MKCRRSLYHGRGYPPEIISHAVWHYYRFCLSFRDVEHLVAKRGFIVSYETIRQRHYFSGCPLKNRDA